MGRCRADEYTDEQLDLMMVTELLEISHGTLQYATLSSRLRGGWKRRQAITQAAGGPRHTQKKSHPLKQFAPKYYAKGSRVKAKSIEENW